MSRDLSIFDATACEQERRLFDPDYYLQSCPGIVAAGIDPLEHFMQHGWLEGRNPSAEFILLYYRDKHLPGECINPLIHYAQIGQAEGLDTAPADPADYFDIQIEVAKPFFSPDIYAASVPGPLDDALSCYLKLGANVDFSASSLFSFHRYRMENSYIEAIGVSPLYHFASQQRLLKAIPRESPVRLLNPDLHERLAIAVLEGAFDGDLYLATSFSVKEAGVDPLRHYMKHGWREGRCPSAFFDPAYYLQKNPDVAALGIEPFFHYLMEGFRAGRRGAAAGEKFYPPLVAPAELAWAEASGAVDLAGARSIIIIGACDRPGTLATIHSVLARSSQVTPFALIVVRRPGSNDLLVPELEGLASRRYFHYADSVADLDCIVSGSCRLDEKSLIFLDGGILVFDGWLDRLMAHEAAHPHLATLSPMGNNADFGSYPVARQCNRIEMELPIDQLDRLASACNAGRVSAVSEGCAASYMLTRAGLLAMAISDAGHILDGETIFRQAHRVGQWNGLAEDIFVYREDACLRDYSSHRRANDTFIKSDPGHFSRFRLDLARLSRDLRTAIAPSSIIVFIYHSLAGGILTYIKREEQRLRDEGTAVIHLRVGIGNSCGVEISGGLMSRAFFPNIEANAYAQIRPHLLDFLGWIEPSAIHVHSMVGFDWASTIDLMALIKDSRIPYEFMLHDYSVVCHRNTLMTPVGRHCGLPGLEICRACVASDWSYPEAVDPEIRRDTYAAFLTGASAVLAPSDDIADRLRRNGAIYPIRVVPHDQEIIPMPVPTSTAEHRRVVIVTFGAISHDKGSDVIIGLARDATARALPIKYHIIGYSNQTAAMRAEDVSETGPYAEEIDALRTAAALSPTFVLVPSIWPETYCYTLSLAFSLGVEALVFDLGAPADRVRDNGLGFILPAKYIDDAQSMNDNILELADLKVGRKVQTSK